MIVEYHEAAFKHNVSESDVQWALNTLVYEKPAADGSFLVVGFNRVGNPLEVAFRELDDETLFIFHASDLWSVPCREKMAGRSKSGAEAHWE